MLILYITTKIGLAIQNILGNLWITTSLLPYERKEEKQLISLLKLIKGSEKQEGKEPLMDGFQYAP